ncbi:nucleotidyltransferase family protein [Sodalis sp. RH19]|uniref:nucleotidyltransferase family protein n=1 Tax=Sodalis sp. RH19 TaxID=3394334 RepID=UPI0039B5AF8D
MLPVGILIAAAGHGLRYRTAGGIGLKLEHLLDNGVTVFQQTLLNASRSGLPIHVVTRSSYTSIHQICRTFHVTFSCADTDGLGETIAAGVNTCRGWKGWLVQLADMPFVSHAIYQQVALALDQHVTVRPVYRHQPGHPVGFSAQAIDVLLQLRGVCGAKEVLRRYPPLLIDVNDSGVITDIDLPPKPDAQVI